MQDLREQLRKGGDVVDPETWAGALPASNGIAPRLRVGRDRWFNLLWLLPIGWVLLIAAIAVAKGLRGLPSVQHFIARHPGTVLPSRAVQHAGFPVWVDVQHFLNLFLMVFIIRAGVQILADQIESDYAVLANRMFLDDADRAHVPVVQRFVQRLDLRLLDDLTQRGVMSGLMCATRAHARTA